MNFRDGDETICPHCFRVLRRNTDRARHACNKSLSSATHHNNANDRSPSSFQNEEELLSPFPTSPVHAVPSTHDQPCHSHSATYVNRPSSAPLLHSENEVPEDQQDSSESDDGYDELEQNSGDYAEFDYSHLGISLDIHRLSTPHNGLDNAPEYARFNERRVSPLQFKAAKYILHAGPLHQGLSIKDTQAYLRSLQTDGEVRQKWKTGRAFWNDHKQRQDAVLPSIGKWSRYSVDPPRADIPIYDCVVRDIRGTIQHVIGSAKHLKISGKEVDWRKHMFLEPRVELNSNGDRILTDWYSTDEFMYKTECLRSKEKLSSHTVLLPLQLFIDKANVTKLNKRSMYPIVLYVLCFSRGVRRRLAVNVAFAPIVKNISLSGKKLSDSITKQARSVAIQETLRLLLDPIDSSSFTVTFPLCDVKKVRPFLMSIVADAPEASFLMSLRYGTNTAYPCPRCFISRDQLGFIIPNTDVLMTASEIRAFYANVAQLRTKFLQEMKLKSLSLRLPQSYLMKRTECQLHQAADTSTTNVNLLEASRLFGISSLIKFEAMHNFDLGLTADILRSIGDFFTACLNHPTSTRIVDKANQQQALLPRKSQTDLFRLPAVGTMIAKTHANVMAYQFFSSIAVLPFLLNGSTSDVIQELQALLLLQRCLFSYLELHHFARRVNSLPYHLYGHVHSQLLSLNESFWNHYNASFGERNLNVFNTEASDEHSSSDLESSLSTLKSHQLFVHMAWDINGGGLLQNFDAQAGEAHHRSTRVHYARSGKQSKAESVVASRSTCRELGVLDALYPVGEKDDDWYPGDYSEFQGDSSGTDSGYEDLNLVQPNDKRRKYSHRKRCLVAELLPDDVSLSYFQIMLRQNCGDDAGYSFRRDITRVRIAQTVRINTKFPWLGMVGHEHDAYGLRSSGVHGIKQLLRASSNFYNLGPQYDYIEFESSGAELVDKKYGQLRLIFEQPYADQVPVSGKLLALVRVLQPAQYPSSHSFEENDVQFWKSKLIELFDHHGCSLLTWEWEAEQRRKYCIINVTQISRPVSIISDFTCPVEVERGSSRWKEFEACVANGTRNSALPGRPENARFLLNPFMPWTVPE